MSQKEDHLGGTFVSRAMKSATVMRRIQSSLIAVFGMALNLLYSMHDGIFLESS